MSRKLPNLIMAGVPKSATTSLFMYLAAHPDICVSDVKETQYFLPLRYGADSLPPIEEYAKHFARCGDSRYIMEATLGYMDGGRTVAQAIHDALGDVRLIFMLRNPIERAFSFYKFEKGELRLDKNLTFDKYIRQCQAIPQTEQAKRSNNTFWAINGGMYANYLPQWYEVFDASLIKVVFHENLVKDPTAFLVDICQWLGLEHEQYLRNLEMTVENKSVNYRNRALQYVALHLNWALESFWRANPWLKTRLRTIYYAINGAPHTERISAETRAELEEIYRPYNRTLAQFLNDRGVPQLPEWLARELA